MGGLHENETELAHFPFQHLMNCLYFLNDWNKMVIKFTESSRAGGKRIRETFSEGI